MATDITSKPVPDYSYEVARRNLEDLDKLENQTSGTFQNRAGKVITPIPVVNDRLEALTSSLESLEQEFVDGIASTGYFPVAGSFEVGGTIIARNQYLQLITTVGSDLAGGYTWGGAIPEGGLVIPAGSTPSSTGGQSANAWVWRSDTTVRSDLANGTADVGGAKAADLAKATINVSNLKALTLIPIGERRADVIYTAQEFCTASKSGMCIFYFDASYAWTSNEIGFVYPDAALNAWNGSAAGLSVLYGDHGIGIGAWVRKVFRKNKLYAAMSNQAFCSITPEEMGAVFGVDATLPVQRAIDLMPSVAGAGGGELSTNGGEIAFAGGVYVINGLEMAENITLSGVGRGITTLKRTTNNHVIKAFGPAFDGTSGTLPWWRCNIKGMTITTDEGLEDFPLVEYRGVTSSEISDVCLLGYGTNLLTLHQVWDSRFDFVEFLGGGRPFDDPNPAPVLQLRSGYGYRQTKELFFSRCRFEGYQGQAIANDSEADTGGKKTELVGFSQIKLESKACPQRHINLFLITAVWFSEVYVTTYLTPDTEPVVNLGGGQLFTGDITIFFGIGPDLVFPKSAVRVIGATRADISVRINALQPETMWGVDWDGTNPSQTNFDIIAPFPTVNGRYQGQKTFNNSTVKQIGTTLDAVQYVYTKDGRVEWSTGNPANPELTNEDWYLRGNGTNFLIARSRGTNPATGYREVIPRGHLQVGKGYLSDNQFRAGDLVFWADSQNRWRRAVYSGSGYPASDTSGRFFQTNNGGNTASVPTSPDLFEQYTNNQTNELWIWFGTAWRKIATTPV